MPILDSIPRTTQDSGTKGLPPEILGSLAQAVAKLRYGLVQLTVHDGKVVQLDVTERHRF